MRLELGAAIELLEFVNYMSTVGAWLEFLNSVNFVSTLALHNPPLSVFAYYFTGGGRGGRQSTITIAIVIPLWAAWHHNRLLFASQNPPVLKSWVLLSGRAGGLLLRDTHSAVLEQRQQQQQQQKIVGRLVCFHHPLSSHTWLFLWTEVSLCKKNMVSHWLGSHGCKINLSAVVAVFPKISALSTPFSSPGVVCYLFSALGVTAGAHRLWSHRSYKASYPLRAFLALGNSMAFQVNLGKCVLPFISLKTTHLLTKCKFCPMILSHWHLKGCF